MADFLLLGLIPGTHIQITFNTWLYAFIVLVIISRLSSLVRKRPLLIASIYAASWRAKHQARQA